MEMLLGQSIAKLPFRGLRKISDLVYFQGPILSHFKDEFNKDFLFYWVDYNEEVNRWILLQISDIQLGEYLLQRKSLYNLFNSPINDIYYSLEIGTTLEYRNIIQVFKGDLNEEYMPEVDSYYDSSIPSTYFELTKKIENEYARLVFMDSSLFIKAEPAVQGTNSNLVGVLDSADFLYGLGKSFKGLIQVEAGREFLKRGISDSNRIKRATTALVKSMQPNVVEAKAASFAIALCPNSYTNVSEEFLDKNWRDSIFNRFKTDIIEIDKKSAEEIEEIIELYGESNASEIFKPLIELYNNSKLTLYITNKDFVLQRTIRPIKKEYCDRLVIQKLKIQEEPIERIAKVKVHARTGKLAGTANATLFDQSVFTSWKTNQIVSTKKTYKLKRDLISEYKIENNLHIIENQELGIFATGDTKTEADFNFYEAFQNLYEELINVENVTLNPNQIQIKQYMQFYL